MLTRQRLILVVGLFALGSLTVLAFAPLYGPVQLDVVTAWRAWWSHAPASGESLPTEAAILMSLRLPRVALGWLVGAGLALAGAAFQGMLRNPLAEPYTLGVAGGGALGAVVAVSWPVLAPPVWFISGVQLWSLLGSGIVVAVIHGLARRRADLSPAGLLLAGVVLASICGAGLMLVRYLAEPNRLARLDRYLMGGLDVAGWSAVRAALPFLVPGIVLLLLEARRLNLLCLGEALAEARGVDVARLQRSCFLSGSLIVAATVAVAGPIGFVGLIVPHMVRSVVGPDHRLLLPCSALAGGGFLVLCDVAARTMLTAQELPVGILTALMGGPFFLVMLLRGAESEGE